MKPLEREIVQSSYNIFFPGFYLNNPESPRLSVRHLWFIFINNFMWDSLKYFELVSVPLWLVQDVLHGIKVQIK